MNICNSSEPGDNTISMYKLPVVLARLVIHNSGGYKVVLIPPIKNPMKGVITAMKPNLDQRAILKILLENLKQVHHSL